jgi:hypothetical protein
MKLDVVEVRKYHPQLGYQNHGTHHYYLDTVVRYRLQIVMMAAINSRIVPIRAGRASPIPGVAAEY